MYISIIGYAKKHGYTSAQVYRWIRESKFRSKDVKSVSVKRLRIKEDAELR